MKNQEDIRKAGTFEDLVFEGRNKSYGAFYMNRKRSKYLLTAFLISFAGISVTIAVPFLKNKSFVPPEINLGGTGVELTPIDQKPTDFELPPPPPVIESVERIAVNLRPVVVEDADETYELVINEDQLVQTENRPVETDFIPVIDDPGVIDDVDEDPPILFPQEPASFMGCPDLTCFRNWVAQHIQYPDDAERDQIFGKVVLEFCVNSKGEVVDIQVIRKIHPAIDEEAIRVLGTSPLWTPAKQGGKPVKQKFVIPCSFEMH